MNILVLGNGFDIAHKLKTSYKDFLKFVKDFEEHYKARKNNENQSWSDDYDRIYIRWIISVFKEAREIGNEIYQDFVSEFHGLVVDNLWIGHFNSVQIKEGWVDFEKEISRIIQIIDEGRKTKTFYTNERTGKFDSKIEEYAFQIIEPNSELGAANIGINTLEGFKKRLLDDLNRTIRALELYLAYFVEEEQLANGVRQLPLIAGLKIDRVLSFNYTTTFEKIYDDGSRDIKYDYIHGRVKKGTGDGFNHNTCNMVLGIDEYLEENERDTDNEFIEFKKFFQRIFKKTGCQYKVWLGTYNHANAMTPKAKPQDINIYFYGHSLDVTDKDIIAELIRQPHATTTIFYHSREALRDQISNLVKVITEEELIERTGDYNPSIIFKPIDENDEFELVNNPQ